jgi:hypothetical protein
MSSLPQGKIRMAHWEDVDAFVNLVSLYERGSTEYASAQITLGWLLDEMGDQFNSKEGWLRYKAQNFKSAVTFLKQCENDPSKEERASTLKGQLFERIQNASEQNAKVTLSLYNNCYLRIYNIDTAVIPSI